jgi:Na+/H+ antiporter NhaA
MSKKGSPDPQNGTESFFTSANAGVDVRGGVLGAAFGQQLTWAVITGLVLGPRSLASLV